MNSNFTVTDQVFGSSTSIAFTSTNVPLTVAQAAYFQIVCTGTLTGNVQLILPGTIGGRRVIFNQCTGAFTLTVLNGAGDTGGGVVVGQGFQTPVVLTAAQAYYDAYASTPPGTLLPFAGVTPPPGFLLCYGQVVSQTTYAQLYAALGTTWGAASGGNFTLPDFRGRLLAGADNMGGSAAGRLTGYTVGTTGGASSESFALTQGNLPNISLNTYSPGTIASNENNIIKGNTVGANLQNGATPFFLFSSVPASGQTSTTIPSFTPSLGGSDTPISVPIIQPTAAINYMIRY